MATTGRTASFTIVALTLGFVCGAWVVGTGVVYRFMPAPKVEQLNPYYEPLVRPVTTAPAPPPQSKAVAVPESNFLNEGSGGLGEVPDRTDLQPTPGCEWVVLPRPFVLEGGHWHSTNSKRILAGYPSVDPTTGSLRYLLVQFAKSGESVLDLRPVFFDAEAKRKISQGSGLSSSRGMSGEFVMLEFGRDLHGQLPPEKVAYFGVEKVPVVSEKEKMEYAQRDAGELGIAILPPASLGQPYTFDLPTADGKRVRSEDLRGKAVLVIVCGNEAMSPLGLKMARTAIDTVKKEEMAVVVVSFEATIEDARKALAMSHVEGSLVFVPNDLATRKLWTEGSQIPYLPMLLLVDREGVLRFNCNSFELQDRVDIVFGRAKRMPRPKALRSIIKDPKPPKAPSGPTLRPIDSRVFSGSKS